MPPRGTKQKLPHVEHASLNIATDEVRVHAFKIRGRENMPRQNAIAKTGSEALDLSFEAREHVRGRAVGNVAVCPGGVLAGGRA